MSGSDPKTKIDLLDDETAVKKKVNGAHCPEGEVQDNGVLAFLKYVIMTIKGDNKEKFVIERPVKFGGDLTFKNYQEVEQAYVDKKLHPLDLKNAVAKEINVLLEIFRKNKTKLNKAAKEGYN